MLDRLYRDVQLHPVKLGNHEFEGENNAYLLDSGGVTALVDTGVARDPVRADLEDGLATQDVSFADLDLIVLTHYHSDHAGLAGAIQEESGARVVVHEDDAPLVRADRDAIDDFHDLQERRFEEWGMPEEKREVLRSILQQEGWQDPVDEVETVTDGDEIDLGDETLRVIHSPGHTAGLSSFEFETNEGREAFVGDAILPVYTPNVGGADLRVDRPLEQYLNTLRKLADREYDRIWPGHRDVIDEPAARARTILDHHHERTENVIDVLEREGPATAWEVSDSLFGELESIHVLHGPGEAFAHLDHLEREGAVENDADGYRLVGDAPDIDDLF